MFRTENRMERRRLVIAMYGLYLVTFAGLATANKTVALLALLPASVSILAFVAVMRFSRAYTLRASPYEAPRPDERQARVRDFAMARSYLILAVIAISCSGLFAAVADDPAWWHAHHRIVSTLSFAVNFLVLSMPEAIIAWNEPDILT